MVSVRCMRPGLPGGKVITAKRDPFSGGGVPMMRAPRSSTCSPIEQSAGLESVDQIKVEVAPEAPPFALVAGPSMIALATLFLSWPVTTRRIGGSSLLIACSRCDLDGCIREPDRCHRARRVSLAHAPAPHVGFTRLA